MLKSVKGNRVSTCQCRTSHVCIFLRSLIKVMVTDVQLQACLDHEPRAWDEGLALARARIGLALGMKRLVGDKSSALPWNSSMTTKFLLLYIFESAAELLNTAVLGPHPDQLNQNPQRWVVLKDRLGNSIVVGAGNGCGRPGRPEPLTLQSAPESLGFS